MEGVHEILTDWRDFADVPQRFRAMLSFSLRRLLICLILLSVSKPSHALDLTKADILTLRLGMSEPDILSHLAVQGAQVTRGERCGVSHCPDAIEARMKDGAMTILFEPGGGARKIVYRFNGRGPNEDAIIRAAVLDHFGTPDLTVPLTWCARPPACPAGQPALTFVSGGVARDILTLDKDGP